jgi:hypothetical protein
MLRESIAVTNQTGFSPTKARLSIARNLDKELNANVNTPTSLQHRDSESREVDARTSFESHILEGAAAEVGHTRRQEQNQESLAITEASFDAACAALSANKNANALVANAENEVIRATMCASAALAAIVGEMIAQGFPFGLATAAAEEIAADKVKPEVIEF